MSDKLLPCPFCGGEAQLDNNFGETFWIQCANIIDCGSTDGTEHVYPAEAIDRWNRRVSAPAQPSQPNLEAEELRDHKFEETVKALCGRMGWTNMDRKMFDAGWDIGQSQATQPSNAALIKATLEYAKEEMDTLRNEFFNGSPEMDVVDKALQKIDAIAASQPTKRESP